MSSHCLQINELNICKMKVCFIFSVLSRPVPDERIIHLLNLKELRLENILALYHAGMCHIIIMMIIIRVTLRTG